MNGWIIPPTITVSFNYISIGDTVLEVVVRDIRFCGDFPRIDIDKAKTRISDAIDTIIREETKNGND